MLVDLLLETLGPLPEDADLREHTADISKRLAKQYDDGRPEVPGDCSDEGSELD